ncbi:MAG: T9SS type A sorting domain-containing protein [Candidatus Eisenbacteria bacterium]|nr:T9SS type A sorting domain-containing protein [Candidatus Eisenbacteria bacterium]
MKRLLALGALLVALCSLSAPAFAAHGWGTGGDSTLAATTVYDVQQYGTTTGNALITGHPVAGDTLRLSGLIVTAFDLKPTTYGFWAQEPGGGPWSGILCYTGADNPTAPPVPANGYPHDAIALGDIVTVQGVYAEFGAAGVTLSEINIGKGLNGTFPYYVQKTGHTAVPSPVRLVTGAFRFTDATCAEQWEGVLVELDSVQITQGYPFTEGGLQQMEANTPPACMGAGVDTCRIDDKMIPGTPSNSSTYWVAGTQYRTVVGIANQENGGYKIIPRSLTGDLTYIGAEPPPNLLRAYSIDATHVVALFDKKMDPVTATDPNNYAMLNTNPSGAGTLSTDSTSITFLVSPAMVGGSAETLYVAGVKGVPPLGTAMVGTQKKGFRGGITPITMIQTPGSQHDSSAIINEWVTTQGVATVGSSEYRSGGAIFIQDMSLASYSGVETYSPPIQVTRGDNVTMAGQVQEFNGKTELGLIFYAVVNSSGNTLPAPVALTVAQMNGSAPATAELYEGMLVATTGKVASDTVVDPTRTWRLRAGADTIKVDRNALYAYTPTPGDDVAMCAILDYYSGLWTLAPRATDDMYCGPSGPLGVGDGKLAFALRQSTPNPFNRMASIRYSVAKSAPTALKIYNVNGQLVRSLFDGVRAAGDYSATWDGRNESGKSVSSGIYYYRLSSGNQSLTKKLVLSR